MDTKVSIVERKENKNTPKNVYLAIKFGWIAGVLYIVSWLTTCILTNWSSPEGPWNAIFYILVFFILNYGLYRRSRFCSISLLILYVYNQAVSLNGVHLINNGIHVDIFLIILISFFSYGVVGTIEYKRWEMKKIMTTKRIVFSTITCVVSAFVIYFGIVKASNWVSYNNDKIPLENFDKTVSENKAKNIYPLKISDSVTINDTYRVGNVLTYEYILANIKDNDFTKANVQRYSISAFKSMCNDPITPLLHSNIKVNYVFIYKREKISVMYDGKDC